MEKKIKTVSVRISIEDYSLFKEDYLKLKARNPYEYKTFSDYIRHLLILGWLEDY